MLFLFPENKTSLFHFVIEIKNQICMKQLILILACVLSGTFTHAQEKKVLVAYFSCTGNTETVAKAIAQATHATLYRIQAEKAYSAADLDWQDRKQENKELSCSRTSLCAL